MNTLPYQFIMQAVIDARYADDICLHTVPSVITLTGGMDNECYFSEVVTEIDVTEMYRHIQIEPPGVYRAVFGVQIAGSQTWTDWGYEYDTDIDLTLLNKYRYNEKETSICFTQLIAEDPQLATEIRE